MLERKAKTNTITTHDTKTLYHDCNVDSVLQKKMGCPYTVTVKLGTA